MNEIRFLTWNTGNKGGSIEHILEDIFKMNGPLDFLLLNECKTPLSTAFCKTYDIEEFTIYNGEDERLKQRIYVGKNSKITISHLNNITDEEEEERQISTTISGLLIERTISRIARAVLLELEINEEKYLFACVHLPSKKNLDEISQLQTSHNYKRYILERAALYNHKVIITGDFNMNPFDAGMVEPMGFFALNNSDFVRNQRTFQHSTEMMFYNPCWWLLGDYHALTKNQKVSGTHFYKDSPSKKLYWHLFDQVIISENMIQQFKHNELEIIEPEELLNELIVKKTVRKSATYSDHLPLKFTLKL